MEKCNNDIDAVIATLCGGSCSYESARQMSVAFSRCLGITEANFMKRWKTVFQRRS